MRRSAHWLGVTLLALLLAAGSLLVVQATTAAADLPAATRKALLEALADERENQATYVAVVERFGEVMPFAHIVGSEGRHVSHLMPLFERYGLAIPANPWRDQMVEVPATLAEACQAAVAAEKTNVALYDRWLETVEAEDVREVFGWLRDASLNRHLPAFERCVERGGAGMGGGRGMGMGAGMGGGRGRMAGGGPGMGGGGGCCKGGPGMGQGEGGCPCCKGSGAPGAPPSSPPPESPGSGGS